MYAVRIFGMFRLRAKPELRRLERIQCAPLNMTGHCCLALCVILNLAMNFFWRLANAEPTLFSRTHG
jgi:hypothetical protein